MPDSDDRIRKRILEEMNEMLSEIFHGARTKNNEVVRKSLESFRKAKGDFIGKMPGVLGQDFGVWYYALYFLDRCIDLIQDEVWKNGNPDWEHIINWVEQAQGQKHAMEKLIN